MNNGQKMKKIAFAFFMLSVFVLLQGSIPVRAQNEPQEQKLIAFTFDDGPGLYTDEILDCLEEISGKATFFVLGCHVQGHEKQLMRMVDMGCDIGCHGFSHSDMRGQNSKSVMNEIEKTNGLIEAACGLKPTLFRAPYGEFSKSTLDARLHRIKWSVDTLDWKKQNAVYVKDYIVSTVNDGDIVLLHDIFKTSAEGFCLAARELVKQNYKLVTVSELLDLTGKTPSDKIYSKKI